MQQKKQLVKRPRGTKYIRDKKEAGHQRAVGKRGGGGLRAEDEENTHRAAV